MSTAFLIGAPGDTGVVLVENDDRLPTVAWCGVVTSRLTASDVMALAPPELSLLPEESHVWYGRPGLAGHRAGNEPGAWTTAFRPSEISASEQGATIRATDAQAGLELATQIETLSGGLLRIRHTLTNTGSSDYVVDHLDVVVPLPDRVDEALDFTGRWARERVPQRRPIADGLWLRENRRGKTGFDAATQLIAGSTGFGFGHGEVWGVHAGWSGNSTHRLERVPLGKSSPTSTSIGGGELLLPGEMTLAAGESYRTPWLYVGAANNGLDALAERFHEFARSVPAHPAAPRPVTLNVWEAVYFDHNLPALTALADQAADLGVERFVLDDGWFGGRRHDRAGLGDWTVSPEMWPDGLAPIADHVHARGMQFGLWFEPEMVNPDSDVYRAHPEWILASGGRVPPEERHQHILDLTQPDAFAHVLDQMSAVLAEYPIDYVKWDHNRDVVEGGSARVDGRPAVHDQTLAYYRLLAELRQRFPHVEWESCASGGGRIDLGVLPQVQRFWTSDQNDALARQAIQRWTAQLVPLEYLGAHVSSPESHQTHRWLPLDFRAATALFGHFGIEWDIRQASDDEREILRGWIALYREHRTLLHSARMVRVDSAVEDVWVHGVVGHDGNEAIMAYVQLDELSHEPPRFRIPGLGPERTYRVSRIDPARWPEWDVPAGSTTAGVSGRALNDIGLPGPPPAPQSVVIVHVVADDASRT